MRHGHETPLDMRNFENHVGSAISCLAGNFTDSLAGMNRSKWSLFLCCPVVTPLVKSTPDDETHLLQALHVDPRVK